MKTLLWCFFSPAGRLPRQEFVLAWGLLLILNFVILHLAVDVDGSPDPGSDPGDSGRLIAVVIILQAWPMCALLWKRLQDLDVEGFWAIPAGSAVVALVFLSPALFGIAAVGGLAYLALKRGSEGENRFGPEPVRSGLQTPGPPAT